jgi:hypothetical protein
VRCFFLTCCARDLGQHSREHCEQAIVLVRQPNADAQVLLEWGTERADDQAGTQQRVVDERRRPIDLDADENWFGSARP